MNRLKALVLLSLSAYLAVTIASGRLYYYIGPRFAWMAMLSVGLLVLPALAYGWRRQRGHAHDHSHQQTTIWTLLIVAVPLVLGIVVPPRPLGASSIGNRGFSNDAATSSDSLKTTAAIGPAQRNVLDWVRVIHADPELHGTEAIKRIREVSEAKVVVLSMHSSLAVVQRAREAGCHGYVVKGADVSELARAIRGALAGQPYFSSEVVDAASTCPVAACAAARYKRTSSESFRSCDAASGR